MLTLRMCKAFSHALGEYLRQADYYSQVMRVEGECFGRLCRRVGLTESARISDEQFERVAGNHHAETGEQLTERMAAGRRSGYDATFNAPKSVSIQAFIGGDERLLAAHETAVREALREVESLACRQEGQGINKRYVAAPEIAGAVFHHGESRALDPHLHSHAFVFNVVPGNSGSRLLALESSKFFERRDYLSEVYRNVLAREVQRLGYAIERREHGFELAGVNSNVLERFSKRAMERDAAIAVREAELGRELSHGEIAILVRETRAPKCYELTPEEVRQGQLAQVSTEELAQLQALRSEPRSIPRSAVPLPVAINRAAEHLFERRTVVPEHELTAEVIRQSYGHHELPAIKAAFQEKRHGLLFADGEVTTEAALKLERDLVASLTAGVGSRDRLGFIGAKAARDLSTEQRTVVRALLRSCDSAVVLRGRAGTGKTHALATAIEAMTRLNRQVMCFAPSTQAVAGLRRDGAEQAAAGRPAAAASLQQAQTVQRLLADPAMQAAIKNRVIVVDEYGLLSLKQVKGLVDLADSSGARLVLVGDSRQHKSVEAGDGARIIERESRITVAELHEVRRQAANRAYRAAAESLAAGKTAKGLQQLDAMGAIVEIGHPTDRRVRMVEEWYAVSQETKQVRTKDGLQECAKTALMVAPTWAEIDALNTHAREKLRRAQVLSGTDTPFVSLRAKDWTQAQHKDVRLYQPGDVLVVHQTTKNFARGEEWRVVRKDKRRLVVAHGSAEVSVSPRQSGRTWTVCEEKPLSVAVGERLRMRSVTTVAGPDGRERRLANGTAIIVREINSQGRLVLADGSVLFGRQVVHGYAMTSHAAQGLTVDKVFLAGAASHEGLYVSATRGREGVRVFVADREAFLEGVGLRSENRLSAMEFVRRQLVGLDLRALLTRGWRHLQRVRQLAASTMGHEARSAVEREYPVEKPALRPAIALRPTATVPRPAWTEMQPFAPAEQPGMRIRM
ncbi:MAG: relaxase domain-containing protein [Verrucomicrobia bacterium]|nr:relaxase domain-containing protein [Verrucomicrobiota bacterium]